MWVTTCTQYETMHTRMEINQQNTRPRSSVFRDSGVSFVTHSRMNIDFKKTYNVMYKMC